MLATRSIESELYFGRKLLQWGQPGAVYSTTTTPLESDIASSNCEYVVMSFTLDVLVISPASGQSGINAAE